MGLDIFQIYVTIDTRVVELGSCDADHISKIVLLHSLSKKHTGTDKVPEDDYYIWVYLPWSSDKKEVCSDSDILEVSRVIMKIKLGSDESGDNEDVVGLGDESDDDTPSGMEALVVVPEVPEEVCEDTDEYHDLFEGYQSKSDDDYCRDSGDEVSDAKLARVIKSNPFKQLERFNFTKVKNGKNRLTWVCMAKGYPWRIHASNFGDDTTMQVKTYKNEHTCHRIYKSKETRSKWIAGKFQALVMSNPGIQAAVITDLLRDQFNVVVDTQRLYKAKKMALQVLLKEHEACFQHLRAYAIMVQQWNPRSTTYIHLLDKTTTFQRMFDSFEAQRKGFLEGCRPFLGIDWCHWKGLYREVLLSAMVLYANSGLYPLAYCICEGEIFLSWSWFLKQLRVFLRYCARHIYANFRTSYGGHKLNNLFWRAVKTDDKYEFKKCLAEIGCINPKAMKYLTEI
ncbi:hypothetical protein Ddye_009535 [Dipteronia dyeriana]|uniref:Transposase MuDR plant domain-containing protein n=1 Tax=Dipteronia dyeriana TaxID=168575 RepID=A0AAD9XCJ0_9ROSI|nr:hypothetical protein Ddye_009535 [Dipteronia dyeriana]